MKITKQGTAIQAILVECLAAGQSRGLTTGGEAKAIEPFYHQIVAVIEGAEKVAKKAGVHKAEAAATKAHAAEVEEAERQEEELATEQRAEAERQAKADREAAERRRDGQSHTSRWRR